MVKWASSCLGQVKVADKSNEITAIPALLELLDRWMHHHYWCNGCKTALAAQIYNASADYVLALKANHPTLHGQVEAWFEQAQALNFEGINFSYNERVEKGDHRPEKGKFGLCLLLNYLPYINKLIGLV